MKINRLLNGFLTLSNCIRPIKQVNMVFGADAPGSRFDNENRIGPGFTSLAIQVFMMDHKIYKVTQLCISQ